MRLVSAYLEYLHLEFQIARLLRRARGPDAIPELLDVSMRLLQTTLVFNTLRNQPYLIQRQIPTIILMYCVPSAGVLALELRRCTREGRALPGEVKKADVVRCLAVLISCLEWVVLPSDGNHRLCRELNKMLALVLDEVLNFEPGAAPAIEGTRGLESDGQTGALNDTETVGTSAVDDMGRGDAFFDFPLGDGIEPIPLESEDFLNWFDNANWNNLVTAPVLKTQSWGLSLTTYRRYSEVLFAIELPLRFSSLKCKPKGYIGWRRKVAPPVCLYLSLNTLGSAITMLKEPLDLVLASLSKVLQVR
jgi:hypothetical protein